MARMRTLAAISLLSFAAVGCVNTEKYNAARMDADQANTRLAVVDREKAEAMAERDLLKQQLASIAGSGDSKDGLIANQINQINDLQNRLADLNRRYADAASKVGQTILLPADLNDALKGFASTNPDLVEFDQNRGIVKFKSDVTFAPGSAILTSNAAGAIDRFAGILNSPAAAGYELMVVGHTDNVRVSHPATISAGHKDNWYLSAHRAISVSSELQRHGVSASRLEVAGCADQRPIAANSSDAGRCRTGVLKCSSCPTPPMAEPRPLRSSPSPRRQTWCAGGLTTTCQGHSAE